MRLCLINIILVNNSNVIMRGKLKIRSASQQGNTEASTIQPETTPYRLKGTSYKCDHFLLMTIFIGIQQGQESNSRNIYCMYLPYRCNLFPENLINEIITGKIK